MNNTKTTKRALLTSAFSMIICVAMLIGTTFAWFTDKVTSSGNKIQAGTLNIDLLVKNDAGEYESVKDSQAAIFNYDLWEPGYTEVRNVKVTTTGNLALKYAVSIVPRSDTEAAFKLAEVIDVYYANREVVVADRADLSSLTFIGTLKDLFTTGTVINDTLIPGENTDDFATIVLKMQESADNSYQGLSVGNGFDLRLVATQYTSEADSFDDQYDKDAEYDDPRLWDGETADTEWYTDELKTQIAEATAEDPVNIEIASANQFAGVVELSKTETNFKNTVFTLESDIDLDGHFMEQIGAKRKIGFFQGTFDGNGHTIYNYKQNDDNVDYSNLGLFGVLNGATVKNLTIDGADISDSHYGGVGIIAGCTTSEGAMAGVPVTVENVHIKNSIVRRTDPTEGGYQVNKIGLFFGNVNGKADVIIKDCSIENCVAVNSAEILPVSPWYGRNENTSGWAPTIENSTATNVIVGSVYGTCYNAADIALQDILSGAVMLKTE